MFGSVESFMIKYNPDAQVRMLCKLKQEQIFTCNMPTLTGLKLAYGSPAPIMWLIPQLKDLCEYSGATGKINARQMEQLALAITLDFPHLKVSELLYFFHRFKSGAYGHFYGNIDPMVITEAMRAFYVERGDILDRIYREEERQKALAYANATDNMTREEYDYILKNAPSSHE